MEQMVPERSEGEGPEARAAGPVADDVPPALRESPSSAPPPAEASEVSASEVSGESVSSGSEAPVAEAPQPAASPEVTRDDGPAASAPAAPAVSPISDPVDDAEEGGTVRMRAMDLLGPSRQEVIRQRHADEEAAAQVPVKHADVIAFANQKGGVAKTTTTLNLAVSFAEEGYRVLCVDLDPQGNLTMSQGIDPDKVEKSLYDVLVHDMPLAEIIVKREIDIAVASIDLAGAEIAMSTKIGRERSLEKALKEVAGDYDFVCIDTPPSLGLLTINALTAANKVIVPVQCEYLSMRGLVQLQNTLRMIQENLNPDVHIEGILPTMLDTRTVHAKEAVEILEENFGDLVFRSRIRKAIKFAEAPVKGSSVLKYDPESNAANYYRELAKEVLANESE
jgi:chromosome partitioning protein